MKIFRYRVALALSSALLLSGFSAVNVLAQADPSAEHSAVQDDSVNTSGDAFYDPPAGYESATPGAILGSRQVRVSAFSAVSMNVQAWQLLYRTTDSDGNPHAAVTTVMIPQGPAQPRPLLSIQAAYDAMVRSCMPSYTLTADDPAAPPPSEALLAVSALERGWAVAIPDPGGIDNRFLTPRLMGYTVLDGIRAAQQFAPLGLPGAATRIALTGYSGGGIGSAWAAELHPTYAPELNIAGAAIGAPVADLGAALHSASGRAAGGLIAMGVAAVMNDSPEFSAALDRYVTPRGRSVLRAALVDCANTTVSKNLFLNASDLLTVPLDVVLADPVIAAAITERNRGSAVPTTPLYLFNAVNDEISPIGPVDDLVEKYCAAGASVTYVRDAMPDLVSNHAIVGLTSVGGTFAWLDRVLAGERPEPGCRTTTLASSLDDGAWAAELPDVAQGLARTLLGQALG